MGLFDFLKREQSKAPTGQNTGASVPQRRIVINNGDSAQQVAAFFHAIELRATTAARACLRYERLVDDKWEQFSYGDNNRLNWLLQVRPNALMTSIQMWKLAFRMRDLEGSAGIYIRYEGERVMELIPVHLTWSRNNNTFKCVSDEFSRQWDNVPAEHVIILKGIVTPGYPLGRSILHYAKQTLSTAATAESLCLDVMSKGGTFKAIVKQEQQINGLQGLATLDDKEAEKNTDNIGEQFAEGKDFIYDPSASQITPITQSFQDLQVDLQRNKAIEDIARFTGVPLPLMFCATNAVYKSIDDAWHTFKTLTIEPLLEEVEQELNSKILSDKDFGKFRFRFDTSALCLDSDKGKAEVAQIYINAGVKTRDEVRQELNLAPLGNNDPTPTPTQEGGTL